MHLDEGGLKGKIHNWGLQSESGEAPIGIVQRNEKNKIDPLEATFAPYT